MKACLVKRYPTTKVPSPTKEMKPSQNALVDQIPATVVGRLDRPF